MNKEKLNQLLSYDPMTGILTWKTRPLEMFKDGKNPSMNHKGWNARFAGKPAGSKNKEGYICLRIKPKSYKAHRLIWQMLYGIWPDYIDHINRIEDDNRLINLRDVS